MSIDRTIIIQLLPTPSDKTSNCPFNCTVKAPLDGTKRGVQKRAIMHEQSLQSAQLILQSMNWCIIPVIHMFFINTCTDLIALY